MFAACRNELPLSRSNEARVRASRRHVISTVAATFQCSSRYPQLQQEVALSIQCSVCSSVQPGTAERTAGAAPGSDGLIKCAGARKCAADALAWCSAAASAETDKVINSPSTTTERTRTEPIASTPIAPPL